MTKKQIIKLQTYLNVDPDGFWGPISTKKARDHLNGIAPHPSKFPTQREVHTNTSPYGRNGVRDGYSPPFEVIDLPFSLYLYGDSRERIETLSPHPHCAKSLQQVFINLAEVYPDEESRLKAGILNYYGIYNPRMIRGGRVPSMHSYRNAIDLDATNNKNKNHWPIRSSMPIQVMECFAREGWLSAGAMWSRDAMHFQATA